MTPDQVRLVQQSFAKVAPIADQAAIIFYDRLFEVAPAVKALFPADLAEQRTKLMATLAAVVNGLSKIESIHVNQGLLGRMLNYGDVTVVGTGSSLEPLRGIADPLQLRIKLGEVTQRIAKGDL